MAKKNKTFSTRELKALLQGIDTYHGGTDWCPDKTQWKRIRAFIDSLEDDIVESVPMRRQMLTEPAQQSIFQQPQVMQPAPQPHYAPVPVVPQEPATEESAEVARIRAQLRANLRIPQNAPQAGIPILPVMGGGNHQSGVVLPPANMGPSEFS